MASPTVFYWHPSRLAPSTLSIVLSVLAPVGTALAQGPTAHEHGVAYLNLALDGEQLLLEFHAPAADLLGFEHAPRNAHEQSLTTALSTRLQQGSWLLTLPDEAHCRQTVGNVVTGHATEGHDDHHDHDDHQGHNDHHDHDGHQGHEEHDHQEEDAEHSDWMAAWQYLCQSPEHLTELSWQGFEHLPSITELRVQGVVGSKQFARTLTTSRSTLSLQP